jgi:hypothetical protein
MAAWIMPLLLATEIHSPDCSLRAKAVIEKCRAPDTHLYGTDTLGLSPFDLEQNYFRNEIEPCEIEFT